jgi:hypothetical protein
MKNSEQPIKSMTEYEMENSHYWGLTKREYFAGLAMQGMLANRDARGFDAIITAEISIKYADEILTQLEDEN